MENLLLFPRNLFHTSHSEEYRWFQGGPKEILGIIMGSRESPRLEGVSRVLGVLEVLGIPGGPRGPGDSGLDPLFYHAQISFHQSVDGVS